MQEYFKKITKAIQSEMVGKEHFTCFINGEKSDFCRFNHGKIRQVGSVEQAYLDLKLISGQKSVDANFTLSYLFDEDKEIVKDLLKQMRGELEIIPSDPHLIYKKEIHNTEHLGERKIPTPVELIENIHGVIKNYDFVGILATGMLYSGYADSNGQFNWAESFNFNLDYSLYAKGDKAIKNAYAGFVWDQKEFEQRVAFDAGHLDILRQKPLNLTPADYRVYLAPRAVAEMASILSWGGFSARGIFSHQSPFGKLHGKTAKLNKKLSIIENSVDGLAPNFNQQGFIKPNKVSLIKHGEMTDFLVSPRSSLEYKVASNGATPHEGPESFDMEAGTLIDENILKVLDTGLYINNLHYLNFSDRINCKITGMTRFATFWVENGQIKAPIEVLRFDDSFYDCFGDNLVDLTHHREFIFSDSTYFQRSRNSCHVPGALISKMKFTL